MNIQIFNQLLQVNLLITNKILSMPSSNIPNNNTPNSNTPNSNTPNNNTPNNSYLNNSIRQDLINNIINQIHNISRLCMFLLNHKCKKITYSSVSSVVYTKAVVVPTANVCCYCNQQYMVITERRVGTLAVCMGILMVFIFWPCFWLPYVIDGCKDEY